MVSITSGTGGRVSEQIGSVPPAGQTPSVYPPGVGVNAIAWSAL